MNEPHDLPEELRDLIDAYVDGLLDERGVAELNARLLGDEEARRWFVRYARLDTDLHLEARAQQAGHKALHKIQELEASGGTPFQGVLRPRRRRWLGLAAAVLLAAVGVAWWSFGTRGESQDEIAWLVNAQDCQWAEGSAPAGDMRPGKNLRLLRGLAEIRFQAGARVVLQGPANLELVNGNSAKLVHGKLTATVPDAAKGFQIVTPQGKVVDLGTQFGMDVANDGTTDVYVFKGKVEAYAADRGNGAVSLLEKQAARIDAQGVSMAKGDDKSWVPAVIQPSPRIVPRTVSLDFRQAVTGSLCDAQGNGTGFTHRLPGTGKDLLPNDTNLRLDLETGQLELTTTKSDLNTQSELELGEYLGMRLADLGFTGTEDFAVTVIVPNIPALKKVGQFGLYAGPRSNRNIRGGLINKPSKEEGQYRQFLVKNQWKDTEPHYVGLVTAGEDFRMTLRREGKTYSLIVENLTTGNSTIVTMPQPKFLEGERDFFVGFFGANAQSDVRRTLVLKEFQVTVWTVVEK